MSSFTEYAEELLVCAKELDQYLATEKLPPPSFDHDVLTELPPDLKKTLKTVINTSNTLKQLAQGSVGIAAEILFSWTDILSLRVIYHYRLAQLVPLTGTASYESIAAGSGLSLSLTQRFLRHAMQNHIFAEAASSQVRHTAFSRRMAEDSDFRDAIGLETAEIAPASTRIIDALETFGESGEQHETAFSLHNSTSLPIYKFLPQHPERARQFGGGMRFFTKDDRWDLKHLLSAFDWASVDQPGVVVVDVGGGFGHVSQFLAGKTEHMHFMVQDLPDTVEQGEKSLPEELVGRVEFVVHDFFMPQQLPRVDVFFLRWILHNWSDKHCVKILKNLVPAMREGVIVLIYEHIIPESPPTELTEKMSLNGDMIMATCFAGCERTPTDWDRLLKEADDRFTIKRIKEPEGSTLAVIEVSWTA